MTRTDFINKHYETIVKVQTGEWDIVNLYNSPFYDDMYSYFLDNYHDPEIQEELKEDPDNALFKLVDGFKL